ncbi:MAG: ubiquinol-cytochrome c reductase iron-sulfur subunit [Deltaproteobacteria bacterium]|nr:ubiquinol-cytochrome c reductase iron-sulfur subunit [Deltaproteobacteria bacterium]
MNDKETSGKPLHRRLFILLGSIILLYPLYRFINHRIPRKPKIIEVSGTLKQDGFIIKNDFIIFSQSEDIWAVSRTCTHLGCRLNFKEKERILECPCHQSRFSMQGKVMNGPAERQLPAYVVEQQGDPPTFIVTI